MFERLRYSIEGKDFTAELKFDFKRIYEIGDARKHGAIIAKVDSESPTHQ